MPARPPRNIAMRPLGGIVRDKATQLIPKEKFFNVSGFIATPQGLLRRPGWEVVANASAVDRAPIRRVGAFWDQAAGATQYGFVMDDKHLYRINSSTLTRQDYVYATGTITATASDATVTGSSTLWNTAASDVKVGDVIVLDENGSGNGPEAHLIASITNDTSLEMDAVATASHAGGSDYEIRRSFNANLPGWLDWCQIGGSIIVTDGSRLPWTWDGGTLAALAIVDESSNVETYIPRACMHFDDRLWIGNIVETGSVIEYRARIRWSDAGSSTVFRDTSFLSLTDQQGGLMRMAPLGETPVLYFEDAIWLGRPTNIPTLPYSFHQVPTGGIGLVGMRALVTFRNVHFFIGQDNIYQLSNRGVEPIGDRVAKAAVKRLDQKWLASAAQDTPNDRICFAFPDSESFNASLTEMWSFNYKSKEWSQEPIVATMIESLAFNNPLSWQSFIDDATLPSAWSGMTVFPSWGAIQGPVSAGRLYYGRGNDSLARLSTTAARDFATDVIPAIIESGDIDLGLPNEEKNFLRISIKLDVVPATAVVFTVQGSVDKGNSWTSVGTLTVPTTKDEGHLTFKPKMRGSTFRYRASTSTNVAPYSITEVVERVRASGALEDVA